jgi:hypothetical protein
MILSFSIATMSFGQKLEKMLTPEKFESYLYFETLDSIDKGLLNIEQFAAVESKSKTYWQVFLANSDAKIYKTYSKTADTVSLKKLKIGSRLFVEEVLSSKGKNWIHVFIDERKKPFHGWVQSGNLILSSHAATLNEESSTRKAMLLTTINNIDPNQLSDEKLKSLNKKYEFFDSYSGKEKKTDGNKLEIYFILKQAGDWWLLSNSDIVDNTTPPTGWIRRGNASPWDSKLCLEPHYLGARTASYKNSDVKIFTEQKFLEDYLANGKLTTSKEDAFKNVNVPPYPKEPNKRLGPNSFRYPVLSKEGGIKHVAAVASLNNSDSEESERTREGTKQKFEELKLRMQNIDILFVVDATSSMGKYMDAIQSSIKRISDKSEDLNKTIRIGLAVYRDYKDGEDKEYQMIQPLTADISRIMDAIDRIECFSSDNDLPEAQYNGLTKALKDARFTKLNSNVLVLIGDAGNHLAGPESSEWMNRKDFKGNQPSSVLDEMNKWNINPIIFQVMNGVDDAFLYFKTDAQKFIRERGKEATAQLSANQAAYPQVPPAKHLENTFSLKYIKKQSKNPIDEDVASLLPFGSYTYASNTTVPMKTKVLEDNIESSIRRYIERVDRQTRFLQNTNLSSGETFNNAVVIANLKSKGFTDKQIASISEGGDFAMRGYTADSFVPDGSEWYFPVIFLTEDELGSIRNVFESMLIRKTMTQTQKAFQDAITELASKMLSNEPKEKIENMTLNDVWEILLDSKMENNEINNIKIGQLAELDDQIFNSWYSIFSNKVSKFIGKSFKDSKKLNQMHTFYWIPVSDLPCYNIDVR